MRVTSWCQLLLWSCSWVLAGCGEASVNGGEGPGAGSCQPDCAGEICGSDGCGGVCGVCPSGPLYYVETNEYTNYIDTSVLYQFPFDTNGWAVVAPGATHRIIYVSSSDGSDSNDGLSQMNPLQSIGAAMSVFRPDSSDYVLLKRGDRFSGSPRLRPFNGESPQHPAVFGAYGVGPRPILDGLLLFEPHENVMFRDLHFEAASRSCIMMLGLITNAYFENILTEGCENAFMGVSGTSVGVTLRRVMFVDAHLDQPEGGASDWSDAHGNRISGGYFENIDGLVISECFADRNGWDEEYDPSLGAGPQPPSMFSHNFYIQHDNTNVVFSENIAARGSSFGAQVRPGGVITGNIFIDNNIGVNFNTSAQNATQVSLVADNVVTIAGNKDATMIGALGWGIEPGQYVPNSSVIRHNIVAHSVDPLATQYLPDQANDGYDPNVGVFTDNVLWNWNNDPNIPSNASTMLPRADQTSLLDYAQRVFATSLSLDAFLLELRRRDRDAWPDSLTVQAILYYFKDGFAEVVGAP